ncbi:rhodanese-like domain-containing protein [Rheinheimera fenheensis]|uniref:rhodanese-like domain-containing protein n=1 Tax=Rheinheimera fenheensis TaxID=3152295 RepID=UPI00325D40C1
MRVFVIAVVLWLSACASTPTNTVWLDVRSADEFAAGHVDGAINIPHTEIAARIGELQLAKDANIALYCGSGRRAGIAIETLQQLGYTRLTNHGGYEALKQQPASNERQ